jgi:hypothetical protein
MGERQVFEENPANLAAGESNREPVAAAAGSSASPDEGITSQPSEPATPVNDGGEAAPSAARAVAVALAGWLLPGLGHALLKMWGRALAIFLTVGFLVYLGAGMRGNVFAPGGEDAFARLGYVADAGTGTFYFVARALEASGSDVSHADGDYGTRFLATAGVLNLLAALHAYEAARGRKA